MSTPTQITSLAISTPLPTKSLFTSPTTIGTETPYTLTSPTCTEVPVPTTTFEPTEPGIYTDHRVVAALADSANGQIMLFNPEGKPIEIIQLNYTPLSIEWGAEDCELLVNVTTGEDVRLLGIDFTGKVDREYFVGGQVNGAEWMTWPSLSPSQQWVAYVVWSGEFYYSGAEFQDIEVIPVMGGGEPIRLTQRGGAWENGAYWSPDGMYLAYSDYDDNGVNQLYYSTFDGKEKHQLTQFTEQGNRVGPIEWSKDGQQIAFGVYTNHRTEEMKSELWVTSLNGSPRRINFPPDIHYIYPYSIRWMADNNWVVMPAWGPQTLTGLYWIDTNSGIVKKELSDFMTRQEYEEHQFDYLMYPIPIGSEQVLWFFSGDGKLYQFDWTKGSVTLLFDSTILSNATIQDFAPYPRGILDINTCLPKK
jgi:WD40 repeat protein